MDFRLNQSKMDRRETEIDRANQIGLSGPNWIEVDLIRRNWTEWKRSRPYQIEQKLFNFKREQIIFKKIQRINYILYYSKKNNYLFPLIEWVCNQFQYIKVKQLLLYKKKYETIIFSRMGQSLFPPSASRVQIHVNCSIVIQIAVFQHIIK